MDAMEYEVGINKICNDLKLEEQIFKSYVDEDSIGGYPDKWECGSIWEIEGKILYALVRYYKPNQLLEYGTFNGCSTSHIVAAMDKNNLGQLITVDIVTRPIKIQSDRLIRVECDGIKHAESLNTPIDFIFEDGPHSLEFTRDVLKLSLKNLSIGGIIVIHDAEHFLVGKDVLGGVKEALGQVNSVLIKPSDCGLAYWRKL